MSQAGDAALDQSLLSAGLEHYKAGDRDAAETCFRRAIVATPSDPTALYLLGLVRFEAGDAAEATQLFETIVGLRPEHAQSWLMLANLRQTRDDHAGAADAYRRVTSLEPGNVAALTGLSQMLLATADIAGALTAGQAATAAGPSEASAHLALAAALAALSRPREAAASYRQAAALAPDSAMAHLGLAVELLHANEPRMALESAERAVALDDRIALGWFSLGAARRALGQLVGAAEAFERTIELDTARRAAWLALGQINAELNRPALAEHYLLGAVELDKTDKDAHAGLSSLYCAADRFDLGRMHALWALDIDPQMMAPRQNLARILAREGLDEEAKRHRDLAYAGRSLSVSAVLDPVQRVLILATTDTGNVPLHHLLAAGRYTRLTWFVEYAQDEEMAALPPYDVVFNAIGDHDEAGPTAANVDAFLKTGTRPVFNPPDKVARTCRHLAPQLFEGIEGLVVPDVARLGAVALAKGDLLGQAARAGVRTPLLVRPIGSHGGQQLTRLETDAASATADAAIVQGRDHYVTAFHDFRAADGLYRKYRIIFVDREPYPYHLAIGSDWMVHYEASGTAAHAERLDEERRFLEDPERALGSTAWAALREASRRIDLDFCGADFSLLPDGRALLFEANATMLVHAEAPDGPLAHKNPHVDRIFEAFRGMLLCRGPL